jgi:hypothetical protein
MGDLMIVTTDIPVLLTNTAKIATIAIRVIPPTDEMTDLDLLVGIATTNDREALPVIDPLLHLHLHLRPQHYPLLRLHDPLLLQLLILKI